MASDRAIALGRVPCGPSATPQARCAAAACFRRRSSCCWPSGTNASSSCAYPSRRSGRRPAPRRRRLHSSAGRRRPGALPGGGAPQPRAASPVDLGTRHAGEVHRLAGAHGRSGPPSLSRLPPRQRGARRRDQPVERRARRLPQRLPRLLRLLRPRTARLDAPGPSRRGPACLRSAEAAPRRGEHPAGERGVDRPGPVVRIRQGRAFRRDT